MHRDIIREFIMKSRTLFPRLQTAHLWARTGSLLLQEESFVAVEREWEGVLLPLIQNRELFIDSDPATTEAEALAVRSAIFAGKRIQIHLYIVLEINAICGPCPQSHRYW
ncbi:hypothetical protein TorRG33x02_145280 [Trema orientale]|uniref:Uncharacterized protein n=1 Tax=Trema orientale TaxID=63057 RepID=A0A2P5EVX3_TREOI|nr:hypothetical protein TorRG33x02_145280 [Trema orientale]